MIPNRSLRLTRPLVLATLATLLALALVFTEPAHVVKAQSGCTNATLIGGYGFTLGGFLQVKPGQPVANNSAFGESGLRTFDGNGNFSDFDTISVAGTVFRQTPTGTYTVNDNCTGTMKLSTGVTEDFTIVDGGKEIEFIVTNPGRVIFGSLKKQ